MALRPSSAQPALARSVLQEARKEGTKMQKLREWGFPVMLIAAWMVAAAYAVSLLVAPPDTATPIDGFGPSVADTAPPVACAARAGLLADRRPRRARGARGRRGGRGSRRG